MGDRRLATSTPIHLQLPQRKKSDGRREVIEDSGYFTPSPKCLHDATPPTPAPPQSPQILPPRPPPLPPSPPLLRLVSPPSKTSEKFSRKPLDRLLPSPESPSSSTSVGEGQPLSKSTTEPRYVDIVSQLDQMDMWEATKRVFRELSDDDLCAACCVSRKWRKAVARDATAWRRRNLCLYRRKTEKENSGGGGRATRMPTSTIAVHSLGNRKPAQRHTLENISNMSGEDKANPNGGQNHDRHPQPPSSPSPANRSEERMRKFLQVAESLTSKKEVLDRCPRCSSPARVEVATKRARCSVARCAFDYCTNCRCPFATGHSCSPIKPRHPCPRRTTNTIPSLATARRNLRRL